MSNVSLVNGHIENRCETETLKRKLKDAKQLICELCEKCGENVCKDGEECDWEESEVQGE